MAMATTETLSRTEGLRRVEMKEPDDVSAMLRLKAPRPGAHDGLRQSWGARGRPSGGGFGTGPTHERLRRSAMAM